jgi:hypothetical protein
MLLFVIAMLAMLPLLALMQHRWLGQVSEGERERMKNNLTASARQFARDFDSELTAAFLLFQPSLELSGEPAGKHGPADFADRYEHWRSTASHPQLVREVYQTRTDDRGGHGLARYDASIKSFVQCEWPEKLAKVRRGVFQNPPERS